MKWILRVMVALFAFFVGVSSSQLLSLTQRHVVQTTPLANIQAVDQPAISAPIEEWQRIIVKGRFSFWLPLSLKDDGHFVDSRMAVGAFRKRNYDMSGLFHVYYYSDDKIENLHIKKPNRYRATTLSEVTIGGKRAIMITEIPAADEIWGIHDMAGIDLYFQDIGGGRNLHMRLSGDDQGIKVAQRVIDSIHFPSARHPCVSGEWPY